MARFISSILLLLTVSALNSALFGQEGAVDFASQIRPILSDRCFACHGPDDKTREADLRLDERQSALRETEFGDLDYVIEPGEPAGSELLLRLTTDDEDIQMPPPESHLKVTAEESKLIERWIKQGAKWSEHWSFESVKKADVPEIASDNWSKTAIDKFVLQRLQQEQLTPNPAASPEVLARRLYFDITGLPPTVEQLDRFLADDSDVAVEKLIDELLASPAYGERMAVDWLDVARYADTYGYQLDFETHVWPYRDWVVKAFNENLPYDDFVTWQLAGDLLPNATREQQLATAFNRLHRQTNEGGSVVEEYRLEYVADRVDTFGVAFLGLSVGCARCHDHKFDPISQKEYYELSAFFDNIDEVGVFAYFTKATPTPALELPSEDQSEKLAQLKSEVTKAAANYTVTLESQRAAFKEWLTDGRGEVDTTELLNDGLIGHFDFEDISRVELPQPPLKKDDKKNTGKEIDQKTIKPKPKFERVFLNTVDKQSNGKIHESPELKAGKYGNGLMLNGDNGFSSSATQDLTRHDCLTYSFWMNSPGKLEQATVVHTTLGAADSGNRGIDLVILDGKLNATICHFWPGNAIRIRMVNELPVDEWIHVGFTYDGSSKAAGVNLYLNGELLKTEVDRDNLTRSIRHLEKDKVGFAEGNTPHFTTVGYRYRDRGFKDGGFDELKIYNRALSAPEIKLLAGGKSDLFERELPQLLNEETEQLFAIFQNLNDKKLAEAAKTLRDARIAYSDFAESFQAIMVMKELPTPRKTFLLNRGAYDAKGMEVQPGVISKLLPYDNDLPKNRLGLAKWLTDPRNTLAARVAVNRIWQVVMGRGIVGTQEDFGSQGGRPSHPELLDHLCNDFVQNGWDIKRLIKQILMSATYQQSSAATPQMLERDPENQMLSRCPSHRLSAEMIRDSALASSGLLISRMGGSPVKPYQPAGVWKESLSIDYERDPNEGSRRRSLYSFWRRTIPPPSMITFDAAKREVCSVRRESTATPLQALVLLNDPQYVEAARAAAAKTLQKSGDRAEQLSSLYRSFTGLEATQRQIHLLQNTYDSQFVNFQDKKAVEEFLAVGDFKAGDSVNKRELAAMTVVAQLVINLDSFIMKR